MGGTKIIQNSVHKNKPINFLFLGVALVTLGMYTNFYDPFNTVKLIILLLLAVVTLSHLIIFYQVNKFFSNKFDKSISLLSILFILGLLLSVAVSDVKLVSILGDTQRRNGLLQYLSLVIIFIYASHIMKLTSIKVFIKLIIIISFLLSTYGLLQVAGLDFIEWSNPYNRMIGTLGNPNFSSALLAIFLIVVFPQVYNRQISIITRMIALASSVMSLIAIISSDSRQGLLTFAVGILFYWNVKVYIKSTRLGSIFLILNFLTVTISTLGMLQYGPLAYFLYKDSISVRGFYWRAALEMFQNKPLFGVGLDRYGSFFKTFREAEYPLNYGYQINSNNAHNLYLQFFSTGGLLLGSSYLLLNIFIFFVSLKLIKRSFGETREVALLLLSAWLGFQAQSIISIDNIGLSIWHWIISGALLALARERYSSDGTEINKGEKVSKNPITYEIYQKFLLTFLLVPTITFIYFLSQSESNTLESRFFTAPGVEQNKPVVQRFANKVLNNPFADPQYKLFVLTNMYDMGLKKEAFEGIQSLEISDPINLDVLNYLAIISQENGDSVKAIDFREKIASIDPWNAENYLSLVKLYKVSKNEELARTNYNKILSFAPNSEPAIQAAIILN